MNEFRHFPFMKNNEIYVRFFIGDKYVDLKLKEVEKLNKDLIYKRLMKLVYRKYGEQIKNCLE